MQVTVSLDDVMSRYAERIATAGAQAPRLMATALNAGGRAVRRETVKAEAGQTGLPRKVIDRAQKERPAAPGRLVYEIRAQGGDVRLKYFGARETRAGVSAAPWGARQVYAGAFTKGGQFPGRVALGMGGHVFRRSGAGRLPIAGQKSGLFIPIEMVTGETASAFASGTASALDGVTRAVGRVFGAS